MADDSFQEKTEEASPKRLAKAREEGKAPKSAEFNSVFILLFGLTSLGFIANNIFNYLQYGFRVFYHEAGRLSLTHESVYYFTVLGLKSFMKVLAPFVTVIALVGLAVNIAQVGFMFSTKPLEPKFSKINPLKGFGKFFNLKSLVELVKGIFKLAVVGGIAYVTLLAHQDDYLQLVNTSIADIIMFIGGLCFKVAIRIMAALLVLAILDLVYQRWQYKKDMRMSKEDIKEETKQAEGDPHMKGAMKSLQMSRARERMMSKVPEADVVITNPTALAIALKYDPEQMDAPQVLAKGARLVALRIKEVAAKHNIPIIENKPLAQSVYKLCDIGKQVPVELFQAIAEVFAQIYKNKNRA